MTYTIERQLSWTEHNPEPETPPIPQPGSDQTRQYAVVRHDFELEKYNFVSRLECAPFGPNETGWPPLPDAPNAPPGLPATCKLFYSDRVLLTWPLQEYWFALLVRSAAGTMSLDLLKKRWAQLTDDHLAFTNGKGSQTCADYINGTNLTAEPMGFETIVTSGNVVEIIGEPVQKVGTLWYPVRALTPNEVTTADLLNHETRPEVVFHATVIRREPLEDGTRRVNSFPQLNGIPVPVPLFSKVQTNLIELTRVKLLPRGAPFPSPYNPPR